MKMDDGVNDFKRKKKVWSTMCHYWMLGGRGVKEMVELVRSTGKESDFLW